MNFPQAVVSGWKNTFNYKDRASRSEYWWWVLFIALLAIPGSLLDMAFFPQPAGAELKDGPIINALNLITFLPGLSLLVRRLHDVGHSGWWVPTILPPLYWSFKKGTPGPNDYGDDPLSFYTPGSRSD